MERTPAAATPAGGAAVAVPPRAAALPEATAEVASAVLRALADPLRLRVVAALASAPDGHLTAGEVATLTDLTAPTVSHHLRALRDAGVVRATPRGTYRDYTAAPGMARLVVAVVDALATARAEADGGSGAVATGAVGDRTGVVAGAARATTDQSARDQAALGRASERLRVHHPDVPAEVVDLVLRDSFAALARTARVGRHLVVLAERFADQRLADGTAAREPAARAPQVLFVCTANAGRSQLAAALVERYTGGAVVARSAGSMPAAAVHATVRPALEELLAGPRTAAAAPGARAGTDAGAAAAAAGPYPKPLTDDALRAADVVVTMGCGDRCPVLPGKRYEDWPVADPALASPAGVAAVVADLDGRVRALLADLLPDRFGSLRDGPPPSPDRPRT